MSPSPVPTDELFFVRYQPQRMLVAAMQMTAAVELAHRRLCDLYWAQGSFPATAAASLAPLLRVRREKLAALLQGLREAGWRTRRGRLTHPAPAATLRDALCARAQAFSRASKGGKARWAKHSQAQQPSSASKVQVPVQVKVPVHNEYFTEAFNAERSALSAKVKGRSRPGEKSFLEDVRALWPQGARACELEMTNWGGWWRNRYRENPDKARAVLAEVRSMRKEGRKVGNPGAAAADLWKRLP